MAFQRISKEEYLARKASGSIPQQQQESFPKTAAKTAGRVGAGLFSSLLSGAADVPLGLMGLSASAGNRLAATGNPEIDQKVAQYTSPQPIKESVSSAIQEQLPEGYLQPKNEYEKAGQDFAETLGSLLVPLGGAVKFGKAAKLAGIGNAAKWATKIAGGSEGLQEGAKLGTMLLTSFRMQPQLKKTAGNYFNEARESVKPTDFVKTAPAEGILNKINDEWVHAGDTKLAAKKFVGDRLTEFKNSISGDRISIKNLIQHTHDINDAISEAYTSKNFKAVPHLYDMKKAFDKLLFSESVPKETQRLLKAARSMYADVSNSERAVNNIMKAIGGKKGFTELDALGFAINPQASTLRKAGQEALGAAAGQVAKLGYAAKNILTNKEIAKTYASMMNAAVKDNKPTIIKFATKLNNQVKKEKESNEDSGFRRISKAEYLARKNKTGE